MNYLFIFKRDLLLHYSDIVNLRGRNSNDTLKLSTVINSTGKVTHHPFAMNDRKDAKQTPIQHG